MVVTMETEEAGDLIGDERVADHRERAAAKLGQIVQQTKQALIDADIDLGIIFVIPSSGHSIITFGTMSDPPDELWGEVSAVVSSIVQQVLSLDRVRCRAVMCAATDSVADHQPPQSPSHSGEPSGCLSAPPPHQPFSQREPTDEIP
jgi:hypothetical protein